MAMLCLTATIGGSELAAQQPDEPRLILTIFAGASTGHALWRVPNQPLIVDGTAGSSLPQFDTLDLRRRVSAGITVGAHGVYYPRRHLGFEVDISYITLPYDNGCVGRFLHSDPERRNEQVCSQIDGSSSNGSAVVLYGGLNLRTSGGRTVNPFVRIGLGLANLTHSSIDVSGVYISDGVVRERAVVLDESPRRLSPSLLVGAGLTSPFGDGYQVRVDVRDLILGMDELEGPTNDVGQSRIRTRYRHRIVLSLGLDIVLEKKRGRRY